MNKKTRQLVVFLFIVAITLAFFVVKSLYAPDERPHSEKIQPLQATDAAFRDGLYLGRMQARQGRNLHPAVGRWGTPDQHDSFLRGYQRGYDGAVEEFADRNPDDETRSQAD